MSSLPVDLSLEMSPGGDSGKKTCRSHSISERFPSQERHPHACLSPCHHTGAVPPALGLGSGSIRPPLTLISFLTTVYDKPPGKARSPALWQRGARAGLAPGEHRSPVFLPFPPPLACPPAPARPGPATAASAVSRELPSGADTQIPLWGPEFEGK